MSSLNGLSAKGKEFGAMAVNAGIKAQIGFLNNKMAFVAPCGAPWCPASKASRGRRGENRPGGGFPRPGGFFYRLVGGESFQGGGFQKGKD